MHYIQALAYKKYIITFAILLTFLELIKTAWIADDGFITLRSVLNFLHGYGPNFNIDERVQAFTHPLWFLLLAAISLVLHNVFAVTFILSITISLLTIIILINKVAIDFFQGILGVTILLLSKAYVDFSSSGLENPLSHLLILLLFLNAQACSKQATVKNNRIFFFLTALLYLTRPDLILLVLPFSIYLMINHRFSLTYLAKVVLIGFLPIILWTLFSLYYYGFPFPNTAYAKLHTGLSSSYYFINGLNYLLDSFARDPITLSSIFLVSVFLKSKFARLFISGIGCYFFYLLLIGGDFMSGRLLTPSLILAVALLSSNKLTTLQLQIIAVIMIFGLININNTIFSGVNYSNYNIESGISDERGYYFQKYGLLAADKGTFLPPNWQPQNSRTIIAGVIGYLGIIEGPGTHIIDYFGLADPLLAKIAAIKNINWRIGHFARAIPPYYFSSIQQNDNFLKKTELKNYYQSLRLITRSKLNSKKRFKEIIKMNLGKIRTPRNDSNMVHYY